MSSQVLPDPGTAIVVQSNRPVLRVPALPAGDYKLPDTLIGYLIAQTDLIDKGWWSIGRALLAHLAFYPASLYRAARAATIRQAAIVCGRDVSTIREVLKTVEFYPARYVGPHDRLIDLLKARPDLSRGIRMEYIDQLTQEALAVVVLRGLEGGGVEPDDPILADVTRVESDQRFSLLTFSHFARAARAGTPEKAERVLSHLIATARTGKRPTVTRARRLVEIVDRLGGEADPILEAEIDAADDVDSDLNLRDDTRLQAEVEAGLDEANQRILYVRLPDSATGFLEGDTVLIQRLDSGRVI